MTDLDKALNCLGQLDPRMASHESWMNVGRVLKYVGASLEEWVHWSQRDAARFKPGECQQLWDKFSSNPANPVTLGTLIAYTQNNELFCKPVFVGKGNNPPPGVTLPPRFAPPPGCVFPPEIQSQPVAAESSPRSPVGIANPAVMPSNVGFALPSGLQQFVPQAYPAQPPAATPNWKTLGWGGVEGFKRYLPAIFQAGDKISIVTQSNNLRPASSGMQYEFSELISKLESCGDNISAVIGRYDTNAGSWIRYNPTDGRGGKDENIVDYRYALVESDDISLDKQYELLLKLQLPIKALVYSGEKSLHAIVHIGTSKDLSEYKRRVQLLYETCDRAGLKVDPANRNPSRLSRLPGVLRNGKEQRLIAVNIGAPDWETWKNDLPPEIETQHADTIPVDPPEPWREIASQDGNSALPPWPWDAMSLVLRNVGQSIATAYDACSAMVGAALLAIVSIAIGNKLSIQIKPGHYQQPNLFFMVSAPVGSGKTPILKPLQQPLLDYQKQRLQQHASAIVQQRGQTRCTEALLRGLEHKLKSTADKPADSEKIQADILALQSKLTDEPAAPVVFCGDATSEALGVRLNANGGAIGVLSGEGRKILAIANGRYADGGDIDLWLAGHAGDYIRIDRMGRQPIVLAHPCISAYVATQPDAVQKLGENPAMRESGFLARWLYVVSEKERGEYPTAIVCPDALRQYEELITKLLNLGAN